MSAPTLFETTDCKIDGKMLAQLAQLCSPDLPAATTTMIGDFAFNEICLGVKETDNFKNILLSFREDTHAHYVDDVIARMKKVAADKKCNVMKQLAAATDAEYTRLCNVFFLRVRHFEVTRISTHQIIGRIVSFPDQVSDDYGNNLQTRDEKCMNPGKALHADTATALKTVYLGYGQGATMAQILGCLNDTECIVFDGTLCAEVLLRSTFSNPLPEHIKKPEPKEGEENKEDTHAWHVISYSLELVGARYAAAIPAALEIAAEAAEGKELDDEAAAYLEKRSGNKITGLVSEALTTRFNQTSKFSTTSLSTLLGEYMTAIRPCAYPYPAPANKAK